MLTLRVPNHPSLSRNLKELLETSGGSGGQRVQVAMSPNVGESSSKLFALIMMFLVSLDGMSKLHGLQKSANVLWLTHIVTQRNYFSQLFPRNRLLPKTLPKSTSA